MQIILQAFYFMLPAYFANMAPVIFKKSFKELAVPLDMNQKIDKKPILGRNKTVRGLIFGIILAMFIAFIQSLLLDISFFANISVADYKSQWYVLGLLMGFGAIVGDSAESFVKRRLDIKSGKPFIPWDQLDFVIGALLFTFFIAKPTLTLISTILVLSFILHITVNHLAFYLKIRNEKW